MKIFIECFYSTVEVTQFNKHSMCCSVHHHVPGVFMAQSPGDTKWLWGQKGRWLKDQGSGRLRCLHKFTHMVSETEGRFSDSQTAVQYFIYSAASASFRQCPISAYLEERNSSGSFDCIAVTSWSLRDKVQIHQHTGWGPSQASFTCPGSIIPHSLLQHTCTYCFPLGVWPKLPFLLQNHNMSVRFFLDSNLLNLHKVCLYSSKYLYLFYIWKCLIYL